MPGIGRYTVIRKIADGGMAEIYLGIQHGAAGFERPVVVKAIRSDFSADPHFRNTMVDEAHIAMTLNHSNVVQVLDLGAANGRCFLILELIDGWDLDRILRRAEAAKLKLPPNLALHICAEVARALAYAHARTRGGKPLHIVHRDISPHNIMVSEQGEVKLTDFGIATANEKRERTVTGMIKGKVGFMSPEQARGEPLDPRSDLFSLGSVLYLLATGKRPFASDSELESLLRTKEAKFPHPDEADPDLDSDLSKLISRAMKKDPDERFENAEEMLAALEKVMRSSFEPAGATELKKWLGELSQRDKEVPLTRLTVPPSPADGSLGSNKALELGEVEAGAQPPRRGPPPPPEPTPMEGSPQPPPARHLGRKIAGLIALAAAAIGAGIALRSPEHAHELLAKISGQTPQPVALAAVDAGAVATEPAPDSGAMAAATSLDAGEDAGTLAAASVPPEDAGAVADLLDAGAPATDAGGYAVASPDAGPRDAGVTALAQRDPEPKPAKVDPAPEPKPDPKPEVVPVSDDPDAPPPVISVKFDSTPPGAKVSIDKRDFGATPTSVRVRSGLAYDVHFVLDGYEPADRHLFVTRRKTQSVQVTLKKLGP